MHRLMKGMAMKDTVLKLNTDMYAVPSQSIKGVAYIVKQEFTCTCPDFKYHGDQGDCKHILAVKLNQGLI